jgi:hypothetical protein
VYAESLSCSLLTCTPSIVLSILLNYYQI